MQRYLRLARPFTLLPPLLGIISGAVCAFGSAHNPDSGRRVTWAVVLTIAIGSLCASALNAAGWAFVASVAAGEAWAIGGIFALFLLGAMSTKDFSDMEGDRAHGCVTLPIRFGVRRAAWMIAPFFVFPWLLIPLLAWVPLSHAAPLLT